jgi:hypothetical protein
MGAEEADELQEIIERGRDSPYWGESTTDKHLRNIVLYRALRDSDRDKLAILHPGWDSQKGKRQYRCDALPERISEAFGDLLYGESPTFTAAAEGDQEALDEIVKENDLPSELKAWVADCSSEGELWWRIYVDESQSPKPQIEMHSRADVVPLWVGRRIGAVAFFDHLYTNEITIEQQTTVEVWRHVEIQTDGLVRNLLYKGTKTSLGEQRELGDSGDTREMEDEWVHGLEIMLAGRVVNKRGRNWRYGVSHYSGIRDQLLDLNEARSVQAENARLSGKKRLVVPASMLDEFGNLDAGEDVVTHEALSGGMDEESADVNKQMAMLEYNFEPQAMREHMDELEETALTRVGLNVQFVNGNTAEGSAESGTALRTRLIPTTLAANGVGRGWDAEVPKMLQAAALVDKLDRTNGGLGASWSKAEEPPTVERGSVLPEDNAEKAERHANLVSSELESLETAITDLHPEWSPAEVKDEIKRIKMDRQPFGADGEPIPPEGNEPPEDRDPFADEDEEQPGGPVPPGAPAPAFGAQDPTQQSGFGA